MDGMMFWGCALLAGIGVLAFLGIFFITK